jgi:hypothetical protein
MKSKLIARSWVGPLLLCGAMLSGGCSGLVKVTDSSIPRVVTPVANATFDELTSRLKPYVELQSLRAWSAYLRFDDLESAQRYREAEAIMVLSRPDRIRLVISIPVVKTRVADMVSENNRFKVAIYPTDYRRFLTGTNTSDYQTWRDRLGERGRSALISARPFHFTDALLVRPLRRDDPRYAYSLEEALVEGPDSDPKARRGARILRSHYVITEIELAAPQATGGQGAGRVRRKFWFDRTAQARLTRQQIFDDRGDLQTEVTYSNFSRLSESEETLWPGIIQVSRPHDNYQARLTFNMERFETNVELPPNAFTLENNEGLPETDLDKPISSTGPAAGNPIIRKDQR